MPADGLPGGLVLERVEPPDRADRRELRLQALLDTPLGFVRTHAESAALGEDDGRQRLAELGGAWPGSSGSRCTRTTPGPPRVRPARLRETGARRPYPLGPDRDEVEMVLDLHGRERSGDRVSSGAAARRASSTGPAPTAP